MFHAHLRRKFKEPKMLNKIALNLISVHIHLRKLRRQNEKKESELNDSSYIIIRLPKIGKTSVSSTITEQ